MPSDSDHLDASAAPSKRVLVAPLNWGLGHVARCIPLIRALENMGTEVLLASDGVALLLLKAEFPHLKTISLPSYRIRYFTPNMVLNIARQMPRILYAIRTEQWQTERIVQEHRIQGVISDNRYGCFSRHTRNIFLTHQLNLRIPQQILEWSANRVLRIALAKFDEIWIPDAADAPTLSHELSHPASGFGKTRYIGLLSRLQKPPSPVEPEYDVAVVLSGPEPQRSHLEQILLEQAMSLPHKFIFILGKTKSKQHHFAADNVEVVSYLTASALNGVLAASRMVIGRSGYSSLMDLAAIGKPALLVPTPGQTEQEYLANLLADAGLFVVQHQDQVDLRAALNVLPTTSGLAALHLPVNQFEATLKTWLTSL